MRKLSNNSGGRLCFFYADKKFSFGVTLVELMVAVAVIGIISISLMSVFAYVAKSLNSSKSKNNATSLIQDKIESIKKMPYNNIMLTTPVQYLNDFKPAIPYDAQFYPPESIVKDNKVFTRYTYIQSAEITDGTIQYFGTSPDTGMKSILVTILWDQNGSKRKIQNQAIISDIRTATRRGNVIGHIQRSDNSNPIAGASVMFVENPGYTATSSTNGMYSKIVLPGTYNLFAMAYGYFTSYCGVTIPPNTPTVQNFYLTPMTFGSVKGTVWMTDHLLISQVVAQRTDAGGNQQWVEIYNPTSLPWKMDSQVALVYQAAGSPSVEFPTIPVDIPPYSFYLFANLAQVFGSTQDVAIGNILQPGLAGALQLVQKSDGRILDQIGWGGAAAPFEEGSAISSLLPVDGELVRCSKPTQESDQTYGPALDTNDNSTDWLLLNPISQSPRNSFITQSNLIAGTPAIGASVAGNDGHSPGAVVESDSLTSASFDLLQVATGTWTLIISSVNFSTQVVSVNVANGETDLPLPIFLQPSNGQGYITGWVKDPNGLTVSGITVQADTYSTMANGTYLLPVAAGTYEVIANPNHTVDDWISVSRQNIVVIPGAITSGVNLTLTHGGSVSGVVEQSGFNLSGISVMAQVGGETVGQAVTNSSGQYFLTNLPVGTNIIQPMLDVGEISTPASASIAIVGSPTAIIAPTFHLTGAFGMIQGHVSYNSDPIRSGVLVVASYDTLTGGPRDLNTAQTTGNPYYTTISDDEGNFLLEARSLATPYKIYAWFTDVNLSTTTRKQPLVYQSVTVNPGQTIDVGTIQWP